MEWEWLERGRVPMIYVSTVVQRPVRIDLRLEHDFDGQFLGD